MKEATGELNLTVFIVIAVGILAAFFYTVVWPMMRQSQNRVVNCNKAVCGTQVTNGQVSCNFYDKNGQKVNDKPFTCPWKG